MPIRARAITRIVRLCANPPTRPPASTSVIPVRNTRRGPNSSASFPNVGWAIALAKYNTDTNATVRPTDTCTPRAMGTSAVAIRELLIGLSADPGTSGS